MGNCIYCKISAGLFRKQHKKCHIKFHEGINLLKKEFNTQLLQKFNKEKMSILIKKITDKHNVTNITIKKIIIECINYTITENILLPEGYLEVKIENYIGNIMSFFDIKKDEINISLMIKGIILRDLKNRLIQNRIENIDEIKTLLSLNFIKTEKIIYLFNNTKYSEIRTKTKYTGGYPGIKIKIAKGIYIKTKANKGLPTTYEEINPIDIGTLVVTTKHIYFTGINKKFRIKLDKIISFKEYKNAIEIHTQNIKDTPKIFILEETWFIHRLLIYITKL